MSIERQSAIIETLSLLHVQAVTCGKVRIGGDHDGGYVMANNFDRNAIAYSIGVGPQIQWDREMALRGLEIHQYDHTVDGLPEEHPAFHFNKIGIAADSSKTDLITLDEMIFRNGHQEKENMLLKIDVEGAEWDVFDSLAYDVLDKFDQIVVEFHGMEFIGDAAFRARCDRVFRKLNAQHVPIHVHGNNYGGISIIDGISCPNVFEMSYCKRSNFNFLASDEIFPTAQDQPCLAGHPDIFLGSFRFKRAC